MQLGPFACGPPVYQGSQLPRSRMGHCFGQ
jgi:hypothetical protein